ncbi:hypothetical protein [uncultured Shimia sp.]|uniref:hypothetical protein n=1 Tax=uncultured Shimia sp. TaxID=573152 RepID=UPI0025E00C38|nr:hypothetical protein [uncultured Shimia sp.]
MSSRRVIVHIGAQKTGSTSLHRFLSRNLEALADRLDIRVPSKGSLTRELGRACTLFSMRPAKHETDLVALLQQVRAELEGDDRVCIISHENICGAMMGRSDVREVSPRLTEIIRLFETHLAPFEPDYVLYTRNMQNWKRSVHNQAVKSDGYEGTLEDFLKETARSRDWDAVQAEMHGLLGAERVRVFALENEITPDRPGRQLLRFAGLLDAEIDTLEPLAGRSNQSLNPGALEFMRQLNQLALAQPVRKQVAELIKNNQTLFADGPMPSQKA